LQRGIDVGMSLIDTAEMYGEGASEHLIGEAINGRRERVFLVSKCYPQNASVRGAAAACERSLRRLGVDCLDLYLLHWRGAVPLQETVEAMAKLQAQGKIRHWGVSNLDNADMEELVALAGGQQVAVNQVLYNLSRRGVEWNLLPWCAARGMPLMAYSPIEQARLLSHEGLCSLARKRGMSAAQLALAWLLRHDSVIVIPKASTCAHVDENFAALDCVLDAEVMAELDRMFPTPRRATPLEML
jgi:diketogulonate reductase-like aldo/keto reductase